MDEALIQVEQEIGGRKAPRSPGVRVFFARPLLTSDRATARMTTGWLPKAGSYSKLLFFGYG